MKMNDILYEWIEKQFYYSNHKKYHKYFKEWVSNLTEDQIRYFEDQRVGQLTKSKIVHLH